jgi:uncharacterized protein YsxB (DUF464 family)
MIRVTLHWKDGQITGFECAGHAGFAEEGSDIVCAAVSILTCACANALESVCGLRPETRARKGSMRVRIPGNAGHDAQVVLGVLRQGLGDLQEQYPDFIEFDEIKLEE